jgi:hypothetical protein
VREVGAELVFCRIGEKVCDRQADGATKGSDPILFGELIGF